jgi:hypothetical protein
VPHQETVEGVPVPHQEAQKPLDGAPVHARWGTRAPLTDS